MVEKLDIVGQVFGRLTVIEVDSIRSKYGGTYYKTKCECGTMTTVKRSKLLGGYTKSCGCLRRGPSLVGAKSYLLTVISEYYENGNKKLLCSCACGNETRLPAYDFMGRSQKVADAITRPSTVNGLESL